MSSVILRPAKRSIHRLRNYILHLLATSSEKVEGEDTIRQMNAIAQSRDAKPNMMPIIYNMQSLMAYRQGAYAQAMTYAEKAYGAAPASEINTHYDRAIHLAQNLNKLGQAKQAETLLLKEHERLKQSERVFDLARLKSILGKSLTVQRRFTEAETVLLDAYEVQKERVLPEQYNLVETRRRLAELYRAWGKTDEARRYE